MPIKSDSEETLVQRRNRVHACFGYVLDSDGRLVGTVPRKLPPLLQKIRVAVRDSNDLFDRIVVDSLREKMDC